MKRNSLRVFFFNSHNRSRVQRGFIFLLCYYNEYLSSFVWARPNSHRVNCFINFQSVEWQQIWRTVVLRYDCTRFGLCDLFLFITDVSLKWYNFETKGKVVILLFILIQFNSAIEIFSCNVRFFRCHLIFFYGLNAYLYPWIKYLKVDNSSIVIFIDIFRYFLLYFSKEF